MGLFDSFLPEEPLECPYCGEKTLEEFQTKCLECLMCYFKIGDKVNKGDECLIINDGKIPVYESCGGCQAWVTALAVVEGNIFVRFEDVGGAGSYAEDEKPWNKNSLQPPQK